MAFVSGSWWDIKATFAPDAFEAQLFSLDGRRIATGRDIGPDGQLRDDALLVVDEPGARGLAERLEGVPFRVRSVESKAYSRRPSAPFMTSTLQQEASRKLRFTAQTTMRVAQRLYENGYITYMRTDSTTLSDSALSAARAQAREI
jgi:DNA topoisomerase-1